MACHNFPCSCIHGSISSAAPYQNNEQVEQPLLSRISDYKASSKCIPNKCSRIISPWTLDRTSTAVWYCCSYSARLDTCCRLVGSDLKQRWVVARWLDKKRPQVESSQFELVYQLSRVLQITLLKTRLMVAEERSQRNQSTFSVQALAILITHLLSLFQTSLPFQNHTMRA